MIEVLVAGVGNIFRGDDGFGPAVTSWLAREPLPPGVRVRDFGVGGLHLAYDLLDPPRLLIVVDAVSRGEAPGTLFVIEPDGQPALETTADPHGMDLPAVFASVSALGGTLPRTLIVGCEPAAVGASMGLSPAVERSVAPALDLVRTILESELRPAGREEERDALWATR
jgi:hydrogenase maturation protease